MNIALADLVVFCALVVFVVCCVLVLHPDYEDGLIGRVALAVIAVASFGRFATVISGTSEAVSNVGSLLWIGLAAFLTRHMCNFLKRKDAPGARKIAK